MIIAALSVLSQYDPARRLLFTHIPKNAGTSIRQWLEQWVPDSQAMPNLHKHHTPQHLHTRHLEDYTHFAVVRNPYDRLLSHYNFHVERYAAYLRPKSRLARKQEYHDKYAELRQGFANWLTAPHPMADRDAKWYDYRWCTQSTWINDRTHVLRYENLAEDFQWVQERVGVWEPLDTLNPTTADTDHTTPANRVLLADHRTLIQSHLMVDFRRFGYAPDFNRAGKLGG